MTSGAFFSNSGEENVTIFERPSILFKESATPSLKVNAIIGLPNCLAAVKAEREAEEICPFEASMKANVEPNLKDLRDVAAVTLLEELRRILEVLNIVVDQKKRW
ncbi:hypothetical protein WICPIJ_007989 [Wickerhamomyces pijperi]|uniref:Uncharacterized protein n=1 Tax=Wickerhamomyces pijperi TaxID=599730 RepID=A0A9P8Q0T7_WICPI|nr:hypothetical protein WICPIJ_007989 [Wickerhamomyces pijperi]